MNINLTIYPAQVANGYALAEMFEANRFEAADLSFLESLQESLPGSEELRWQIHAYQRALQAEDKREISEWGRLIAGRLQSQLPRPSRNGRLQKPAGSLSLFGNGHVASKRIEYKIGCPISERGGHSIIFFADRKSDGETVVIKVLRKRYKADPSAVSRFKREQRILIGLKHPSLPVCFGRGNHFRRSDLPFTIMEYLPGPDLSEWLERKGFLRWSEARTIFLKLASVLEMLHRGGIVHRDLKPENIILIVEGERIRGIKLIDFSIALNLQESGRYWDERVSTVGTPLCSAPEQILGWPPQDGRTDIYGLGILMFELLAGRPPFFGSNADAVFQQHLHKPPPRLRDHCSGLRLPKQAEQIVMKALAKNPADRFQTMAEMAEAIERCR